MWNEGVAAGGWCFLRGLVVEWGDDGDDEEETIGGPGPGAAPDPDPDPDPDPGGV